MKYKRFVALFAVFCVIMALLMLRIYRITLEMQPEITQVTAQYRKRVVVAKKRANIYDCNFNLLSNTAVSYRTLFMPSVFDDKKELAAMLKEHAGIDGEKLDKLLSSTKPFVLDTDAPVKSDGAISFKTVATDRASDVIHIIGYTDKAGEKGIAGIEKAFDSYLSDGGSIDVVYEADAKQAVLSGLGLEINDATYYSEKGIKLTLDRNIQRIVDKVADEFVPNGAVVVTEIGTGQIKAISSRPTFKLDEIDKYLDSPNGELLNRAFLEYNVGSVFKLVVAAAALEKSQSNAQLIFDCPGYIDVGGQIFHCHNRNGHGKLDMAGALARSCNVYFISLALELDYKDILEMAKKMGLEEKLEIAPNMSSAAGMLPSDKLPLAAIANLAIGQGDVMVTPLQVAQIVNIIANDGVKKDLHLYDCLIGESGEKALPYIDKGEVRVISSQTAQMIRSMMVQTVQSGTGTTARPLTVTAGGKTASAETGIKKEDKFIKIAWFSGFFPAENPKYSIVVMTEDGTSGSVSCAPVFKQIADRMYMYVH